MKTARSGSRRSAVAGRRRCPARAGARRSKNTHPDVRLGAAKAFARHGDVRALEPLLALATAPEPLELERRDDWLKLAESALDGLGELGDPAALPHLIPLLDSPRTGIRLQAARALVWVSRPGTTGRAAAGAPARRRRGEVPRRQGARLRRRRLGGPARVLRGRRQVVSVGEQIAAALAIGAAGEDRLAVYLDDARDEVRFRARSS